VREALWWKLGKKGISSKFIGVKGIYKNVKISVKLEGNRVLEEFDSNIGLRQGCSLSPAHTCTKSCKQFPPRTLFPNKLENYID
jgi:hypothetical protein